MSTPRSYLLVAPESSVAADPRLERFVGQWAALLTTFRRDGTPVATPVSVVVEGGHALVRTYDRSGKAKRLRTSPRAQLSPCTWRGRPTGSPIEMKARLLDGEEAVRAGRMIDAKHPFFQRVFVRLGHRLQGYRTLHFELTPI